MVKVKGFARKKLNLELVGRGKGGKGDRTAGAFPAT